MSQQIFGLFKKSKNTQFKDIIENEHYQVESVKPIEVDRNSCHMMVNFEPNNTAENTIDSDHLLG